ncbi:hypothetical protein Ae201684P_003502 [Aphanomyces euteiches]|nr:hypothetical protein Ae201684P_003502 [Aphanomyces euteiches]
MTMPTTEFASPITSMFSASVLINFVCSSNQTLNCTGINHVDVVGIVLKMLFGVLVLLGATWGCRIFGSDTGECTEQAEFLQYMPFCGPLLPYTTCVPRAQTLWYNHSVKSKDLFLAQICIIEQPRRGRENKDCQDALKNYMCWLNFPRCDNAGRSLIMCRSVCENFFKACMQHKDLWRCGDPQYVNGYSAEISTTAGELQYFRYPFPGSPFRDNEFTSDKLEALVVCTPSLLNGVNERQGFPFLLLALITLSTLNTY